MLIHWFQEKRSDSAGGTKAKQQDARSSATSQLTALAHLDPGVHLLLVVVGLLVLRAGVSLQLLHAGCWRGKEGRCSRTKRQWLPLRAARGLRSDCFGHCWSTAGCAGPPVVGEAVWAPGRRLQQQRGQRGCLPACRVSVIRSGRCCGRSVLLLGARPTDTDCLSVSLSVNTNLQQHSVTPPSRRV